MKPTNFFTAALLSIAATFISLSFEVVGATDPAVVATPIDARIKSNRNDISSRLLERGEVRVIVGLRTAQEVARRVDRAPDVVKEQAVAARQLRVLQRLAGTNIRAVKRLRLHDFMTLTVDASALDALAADPEVTSIQVDEPRYLVLNDTPTVTRATNAWAVGALGAGQVVAVLDTGVDKTHPFFSGKVVAEACFSRRVSGNVSYCPGGVDQSFAPGSAAPCPEYSMGCWHGTHVAGIAVGRVGVLSATTGGIAPEAGLIAIQVFQRDCASCGLSAYDSDILAALDHVYSLRNTYNIASVNLSVGGGSFAQTCDVSYPGYKALIDSLDAAGVATVVAAGNNGNAAALSSPGCLSNAISVGSTTKQNAVSSFSNSASFLSLLAPGSGITSSVPLAYAASGFSGANGTSMAAPHVAGAWALLKSANAAATVPQILLALQNSGVPITDPRNGLTKPLIRIGESPGQPGALGLLGQQSAPTVAVTAPANGASFSAPANIILSASAGVTGLNASISRVEFYRGATKIGEALAAPYSITWANAPRGAYTVTARATDSLGGSTVSAPVSISVVLNFTIQGTVSLSGSGLSNVGIAATNGVSCPPSNASGQYSCVVPSGWSGTITPARSGYSFSPPSLGYSNVAANLSAQNFAATAAPPPTYQVNGTVTLNGVALASVSMAATSGVSCTSSNASGQYSCVVPQGWSGTVTPSLSGHTFVPSSRGFSNVAVNQSAQNYAGTLSADTVWVEDALPAGATAAGNLEGWSWVSANPAPFSGNLAHQSALVSGRHQHYFYNTTSPLSVATGDTLFAYVYLDPVNPPSQVMLQWNDGQWEHRAYWGANVIPWGVNGTASRRYMGALPPAGQWVRLEVPAALVGLEGRSINGMAFTLQDGRATWDRAGKGR